MRVIYKLSGKDTPEVLEISGVFYNEGILYLISNNLVMFDVKVYGISDLMASFIIKNIYEYGYYDFTLYMAEEDKDNKEGEE